MDLRSSSTNNISANLIKAAQILEVSPHATYEEAKKAYRKQMLEYHPDKHQDTNKKRVAEEVTTQLNWALEQFKKF